MRFLVIRPPRHLMLSYRLPAFGAALVETRGETPRPTGHEVVLAVAVCGVCHSDVHLADGWFDLGGGARVDLTTSVAPPRTLGHEIAGTVVAVGDDVSGVAVGDRRVVYPWIGCGRCAICAAGDEQLCAQPRVLGIHVDGGFADHVVVPHPRYLFDFAPLAEEQACTYACSGLTAYAALNKLVRSFGIDPAAASSRRNGEDGALLVIGAGGVGLSGVRMCAALGLPAPIVAEVDRAKWDLAREAGAADVVDPTSDGASRALVKATGGGVAAAIDFVGSGASFAFGFGTLRKGGTLVSVGLFGGATSIAPAMIALKAIRVVGSYVGSPAEMAALMTLARAGSLPALPVERVPLAEASSTLAALKAGRVRGRAVLAP